MAISIMASGNTSIPASAPGAIATKEVTVAGMTAADNSVQVNFSHTADQTTQRNPAAQYTMEVVKGAGKFTVYMNQKQTPELYFDYMVLTGTA